MSKSCPDVGGGAVLLLWPGNKVRERFVGPTRVSRFSKFDFSELRKFQIKKIAEKKVPSMKSPNLAGFWTTPPELGEISF